MAKTRLLAASLLTGALIFGGCASKANDPNLAAGSQGGTPATSAPNSAASTGATFTVKQDGSQASYSVGERFLALERDNAAVGTTTGVTGNLVVDGGKLTGGKVTVDLRSLKSDSDKRDGYIKNNTLETAKYPNAEFQITGTEGGTALKEGEQVSLKLNGDMTIHGTTKPITLDAKVTLKGSAMELTATAGIKITDFGMKPPNVLGFVAVKDDVKLEVQVKAAK